MTFLSGWAPIALAAGLTVPPLVALYFLKLRRRSLPVSSTLLWKRAVEDLQVNAPFQRIKNNLLLWLQLLILLLAAFALGRPMVEAVRSDEDTLVVLIDQSASMAVEEADGQTRMEIAKDHARRVIDNMPDGSKAMVIGFSDRASIISSFETDRKTIKKRIDEIEATESTTTLSEAMALAEAYMQNLVIAGDGKGQDIATPAGAAPARAVILTDGNIQDSDDLTVKHLPTEDMEVVCIGDRSDNVAILSMNARRNYERPAALEVFALVRNFGPGAVALDANLYINGEHVDVKSMTLRPGRAIDEAEETSDDAEDSEESEVGKSIADQIRDAAPAEGSVASVAFDEVEYEGGGVVEVRLNINDALSSDNRAWTVVQPPRNVFILLVSTGDVFLERLLSALPVVSKVMSPLEYEDAAEDEIELAGRAKYDVVIFENHSTDRLPPGNYIFLGGVPEIEGVSAGENITDEVIFNWDEAHPIMRYVAVDSIQVFQWSRLTLPAQAEIIMEGESSPVMAFLSHEGRQYLISAFGILAVDEISGSPMLNTDWVVKAHFPVFISNAVQYLAGSLSPKGIRNIKPGQPIEFPVPDGVEDIFVRRPDGNEDRIPTGGFTGVNYARTRRVGVYKATPGIEGRDHFAVNLFDAGESDILTRKSLNLSGVQVKAEAGVQRVNKPFWPWLLLGIVVVMAIEWAVYSKRVYV